MKNLSKHKTHWTLLAATSIASVLTLSGCASPHAIVCREPVPLPAKMSEPQSPGAKAFSEKAQSFLRRAEAYFNEMPQFTTP